MMEKRNNLSLVMLFSCFSLWEWSERLARLANRVAFFNGDIQLSFYIVSITKLK